MEKQRFTISTKKSLYPPIEIVIDGVTYFKEVIPPQVLDEVEKYEETANKGDINAVMNQLQLLTNAPAKVLKTCDVRDLQEMMSFISTKLFNPKRDKDGDVEEKKSKTGEENAPQ